MIYYKGQLLNDFEVIGFVSYGFKGIECSFVLKSCFKGYVLFLGFKIIVYIYICNVFIEIQGQNQLKRFNCYIEFYYNEYYRK